MHRKMFSHKHEQRGMLSGTPDLHDPHVIIFFAVVSLARRQHRHAKRDRFRARADIVLLLLLLLRLIEQSACFLHFLCALHLSARSI